MVELNDGRVLNTCPSAGICADFCYAKRGSYRFSNVLRAHVDNLLMIEDELPEWERRMNFELDVPKFKNAYVRIHDAGDFYSDNYLSAWLRIIEAHPDTHFYAYTKEVKRIKRMVEGVVFPGNGKRAIKLKTPPPPPNFTVIYSLSGTQDQFIDIAKDRHADVYPSAKDVPANYRIQTDSDLLALDPDNPRIAIVTNNHKDVIRKQGVYSFGQIQALRPLRLAVQRLSKNRKPVRQPLPKDEGRVNYEPVDLNPYNVISEGFTQHDHTSGLAFLPMEELRRRSLEERGASEQSQSVFAEGVTPSGADLEELLLDSQVTASSATTPSRWSRGQRKPNPNKQIEPPIPGLDL